MQKLQERTASLEKMNFSDEVQREKWKEALKIDMMSSEESGLEGDEDVIFIKPLQWRSEHIEEFFRRLDQKSASLQSAQARRQKKKRIQSSEQSSRPIGIHLPPWAVRKDFKTIAAHWCIHYLLLCSI